jgi:hypothetical protein
MLNYRLAAAVYLLLVDFDKSFYYTPFHYMFYTSYTFFDNPLCNTALTLVNPAAAVGLVGKYTY